LPILQEEVQRGSAARAGQILSHKLLQVRSVQRQFSAGWLLRSRGFLLLHKGKSILASLAFYFGCLDLDRRCSGRKGADRILIRILSLIIPLLSGLSGTMGHAMRRLRGVRGGRRGNCWRETCVSSKLFPLPKMSATVTGTGDESISCSRYAFIQRIERLIDSFMVDVSTCTRTQATTFNPHPHYCLPVKLG
jgi:uncharacterized protein involved in type VI secretion and phage assembly